MIAGVLDTPLDLEVALAVTVGIIFSAFIS